MNFVRPLGGWGVGVGWGLNVSLGGLEVTWLLYPLPLGMPVSSSRSHHFDSAVSGGRRHRFSRPQTKLTDYRETDHRPN